ncbi:MAG: F0F1 ATP synthase subunit epsilon [Thiohalocapsa sp.]|jgi:F-type H+-transporting ATPase subunit epsilon|uniref:F0F1 ATP synthase subunit epsilon n=1 Tax=Thiohalocapsa sp. TaxID=2497641 RepID=UPI0025FF80D9|nr:F0F1 ATP synthase subunit epsilon [Thiohalocapsa sp.]MCG6942656.1 F0F1 ATP synthase subunit epsilon [Thiohalocapsa sp.]
MSGFTLHLQDALSYTRVDGVQSFVGVDPSGSFGLLPGHARFMTSLKFGLARFRGADDAWEYLALPGALVHFVDNELFLSTRRLFRGPDYAQVDMLLRTRLAAEEQELAAMHESLKRLEREMLKRLHRLSRLGPMPEAMP